MPTRPVVPRSPAVGQPPARRARRPGAEIPATPGAAARGRRLPAPVRALLDPVLRAAGRGRARAAAAAGPAVARARTAVRAGPRRGPASLLAAARTSWRRSLQLRVVATTVLLGMVAVTLLGAYLAGQISDRLFVERREQVLAEADQALTDVQELLAGASVTNRDEVESFVLDQVLPGLERVNADRERGVLLLRPPGTEGARLLPDLVSGRLTTAVVPARLRATVRDGDRADTPVRLPGARGPLPGLAVGDLVDVPIVGEYELYLVFSLEREQRTLEAVQRVLVVGGVALVALVGGVAWVVTRQVVTPVRQAAGVAARLADGDLDQRMQRRGQDDLARLAGSFNAMAASLQEQIGRMEELSRLQQRFVSDVSHELRTPLTTIRMAGEVLHESRHSFDPAVARSAELLAAQLDRFEELLADLLEISRFDAGAAALDAEAVDVRTVVERVRELAAPVAERRGGTVTVDAPATPCMAEIDARRVERVVRNLVLNAVEHGEGRPVQVTLRSDADSLAVRVRDHGVGLEPEQAERVFDRFWRADPARARSTGGTGLGLAISLEDAHLHGGTLRAWGRPGDGAAFLLVLPRRAGARLVGSPLPLEDGPGAAPQQPAAPRPAQRPAPGRASGPASAPAAGSATSPGRAGPGGAATGGGRD